MGGVLGLTEEEEKERRRSCAGGARGRRREARRSDALAQRSASMWAEASGAGLVCFSMGDGDGAAFPWRALGGRLLEASGRFSAGVSRECDGFGFGERKEACRWAWFVSGRRGFIQAAAVGLGWHSGRWRCSR